MAKMTTMTEVEDALASRLARQVADEVKYREIANQTFRQFYFGSSIPSAIARLLVGIAIAFYLIWYLESSQDTQFWIIPVMAAVLEIIRLNSRIDALNKLFQIHTDRANRTNDKAFNEVMEKIPDIEPKDDWDKLPE